MGGAKFPGIQVVNPKGLARMEDKIGTEASQEDTIAREAYVKAVRKGIKRLKYRETESIEQGAPEATEDNSVEPDPQSQPMKRTRTEKLEDEVNTGHQSLQEQENTYQDRGACGGAPLQSTPVSVKVKRLEERLKGNTPRGTKRKKEPDPHQSRMTQYFSRREKIEASASNKLQGVTCDPLLGDPGSCEPTTTSGGATGLEPEVRGGAKEQKEKKKKTPTSVLERWLNRPGASRSGTQAADVRQGGKGNRGVSKK